MVDNLTGASFMRRKPTDAEQRDAQSLAASTVEYFLRGAIFTTPSGKQNTFAAHQLPAVVLIEVRPTRTPVSYANAFVEPARATSQNDLVKASMALLSSHVSALTNGFNLKSSPRLLLAPLQPNFAIEGVQRADDIDSLCFMLRETLNHG